MLVPKFYSCLASTKVVLRLRRDASFLLRMLWNDLLLGLLILLLIDSLIGFLWWRMCLRRGGWNCRGRGVELSNILIKLMPRRQSLLYDTPESPGNCRSGGLTSV